MRDEICDVSWFIMIGGYTSQTCRSLMVARSLRQVIRVQRFKESGDGEDGQGVTSIQVVHVWPCNASALLCRILCRKSLAKSLLFDSQRQTMDSQ